MKKRIFSLAVVIICLAILASGTLAYFTTEDTARNVITSGGLAIELVEGYDDDGNPLTAPKDFPEEGLFGIMPGTSASKIVSVKNTGASEAWIRVWVNVGISEDGDPITNPTIKNLPLTITNADGEEIDVVTLDFNSTDWTKGEDGYYYYNSPVETVEPKNITAPLFNTVAFAKEMGNEYQGCKVIIDVSAEAVQTANNPKLGEGKTLADVNVLTDVTGWPEA